MRISDWSSDVCTEESSPPDMPTTILSNPLPMAAMLEQTLSRSAATARSEEIRHSTPMKLHGVQSLRSDRPSLPKQVRTPGGSRSEERRVGKDGSVRVDLGGRRTFKKKKN